MVLKIEILNSSQHQRSEFSCGEDSLDIYLRQQASQDLKKCVAQVFVLTDTDFMEVMGYYTLSAATVEIINLEPSFAKRLPHYPSLPATLLGRLAVDKRYQDQKLGQLLLVDAFKKALQSSQQVASLAIIVDAWNERAFEFYQKYGFIAYKNLPSKLYLPMATVAKICRELGY